MRILTSIFCAVLWFYPSLGMQFPNEEVPHNIIIADKFFTAFKSHKEVPLNTTGDRYILTAFKSRTNPKHHDHNDFQCVH